MASARKIRRLKQRIKETERTLEELYEFRHAMLRSDVNSYTVGSRNLSRYKNLQAVEDAIAEEEKKLDLLEAELETGHSRRTFAVLPRDW